MSKNTMNNVVLPNNSSAYLMRRLLVGYVKPYVRLLLGAIFFMLIAAAMTAMIAQLMQPILDDVLSGEKQDMILPIGALVFVTFLTRGLSTYAHVLIMNKVGQSVIADVQKDLFAHFMKLDLTFFHSNPSGQLISRVINDVNVIRAAVSDALTGLGKSLLTLLFLVAVMFYQDWQLSMMAFTIFPVAAYVVSYIGRRLRKISKNVQVEMGSLSDRLSQIFQGIRQVQAYGMEKHENQRAEKAIDNVKKLNIKSVNTGNLSTPVNELLIGLVACGIIIYGGYQVSSGVMTTGQLVAFLAAFTMAYEPMKKLARLNNTVQRGLGAAERVFDMLDTPQRIKNSPEAIDLKEKSIDVSFQDVVFEYEAGKPKALNGVSFTAKRNQVTALVGPSGGGKTTIINLIPRFYDVLSGGVSINKHNIKDLTLESLRTHIALVSQDITMFDETIAANIAYGSEGSAEQDIIAAAKKAAADDFISAFPEGYQTRVGESGVKLSGGQKQRIAIARALLRDAPLLLLDEATSALDNESEQAVQAALKELEKGRTTIVIAHRLSTIQSADKIIVLDRGQIAEVGNHKDLMYQKGLYAKMHTAGFRE